MSLDIMLPPDTSPSKDQLSMFADVERLQSEIDTSEDASALFETDEFRIYCYKVQIRIPAATSMLLSGWIAKHQELPKSRGSPTWVPDTLALCCRMG